jgi:hypothetical protein
MIIAPLPMGVRGDKTKEAAEPRMKPLPPKAKRQEQNHRNLIIVETALRGIGVIGAVLFEGSLVGVYLVLMGRFCL